MSLTPKNWKEFQHYSDRKPAWIKLHRGLLDDFGYSRLPLASRALAPMLWLLASEYEGGAITAAMSEIAFRLRITEDDLSAALTPLIEAGFFLTDSVPLSSRKQEACLEREKQEETQEQTESRARARETVDEVSKIFEEFWTEYPSRAGGNPKAPAVKAFVKALATGKKHEINREVAAEIVGGAKRFAAECRERGKVGTEYVPHAATWLNQRRWEGYPEKPPDAIALPPGKFYGAPESPQLAAWDNWSRATRGKPYPRDRSGGWVFDTEWPPEIELSGDRAA